MAVARPARAQVVAEPLWAMRAGGTGRDYARQIVVDPDGNMIVAGQFAGNATFDRTNLTGTASRNAFVAKYSSAGALLWARALTASTTNVLTCGLSLRSNDTIYVAAEAIAPNDARVLLLSKFNASGEMLWTRMTPGIAFAGGEPTKLMGADAAGNLYLAGGLNSFQDLIVIKLDADGNELWRRISPAGPQSSNSTSVYARGLAVDSAGNCAVTGWFTVLPHSSTTLTLGSVMLQSNSKYSTAFTASYDSAGTLRWARTYVPSFSAALNYANDVAVDESGMAYATGLTTDPPENSGPNRLFLVKYDGVGNVVWTKKSAGPVGGYGNKVSVTPDGNVIVLGRGSPGGAFRLDSIEFTSSLPFYFLFGFDSDGHPVAAAELYRETPTGFFTDGAFTADASGDIYYGGAFFNSLSVGSTTLSSAGNADVLLVKFSGASLGPRLRFIRSDGQLVLSWPAAFNRFALEAKEALVPAVSWHPVSPLPVVIGNQNVVILDAVEASRFYRLREE